MIFFNRLCTALKWRFNAWFYRPYVFPYLISVRHLLYVRKLKKKNVVNVVFLPMNVAMWKCQHLYDLLKKDSRFRLFVFLAPARTYSYETRCSNLQEMRTFFTEHNVPYIDYELEKGEYPIEIRSIVDPDILFYAQPYDTAIDEALQFMQFKDKLLCYIPYGFSTRDHHHYNQNMLYFRLAWKLYYQISENKELAKKHSYNRGRNGVVVGYSSADDYVLPAKVDPWKVKDKRLKRIIWAPHFTIVEGIGFAQISNFLNIAELMCSLALSYSNKITIAFKPHPRLYSELVKHPEWGEKRTNEYYNFWRNGPTTQLETGDFVDLFKGSDAMIHDCGSFTVDYLYFNKPVLYDNPDVDSAKETANEAGRKAYDVHYHITCNDDIKRFIDDVVLSGNDPLKQKREEYYQNYLLPPNGKTVAQNIYDDMIKSLGLD